MSNEGQTKSSRVKTKELSVCKKELCSADKRLKSTFIDSSGFDTAFSVMSSLFAVSTKRLLFKECSGWVSKVIFYLRNRSTRLHFEPAGSVTGASKRAAEQEKSWDPKLELKKYGGVELSPGDAWQHFGG